MAANNLPEHKQVVDDRCQSVVIIASQLHFPQGMASAQRVKLLAGGLIANDVRATVFVLQGIESREKPLNTEVRGTASGVEFEYTCGTVFTSRSWLGRRWRDLRGYVTAMYRLWRMKRDGRLDAVILYTRLLTPVVLLARWCRLLGVPVILELCEWPLSELEAGHGRPGRAKRFCNHAISKVDAVLPISSYIEQVVENYCTARQMSIPMLRIPIIVDAKGYPDRRVNSGDPCLMFCASYSYRNMHKLVLDTCAELKRRSVRVRLRVLGGRGIEAFEKEVRKHAQDIGVMDTAEFFGYVSDEELKRIHSNSTALFMPLADDAHSVSRFPQKLGEYLASGSPVITTAMGEIPAYLTDGVNAFFTASFTPEALADTIQKVLADPRRAEQIGKRGRDVAHSEFEHILLGRKLKHFLEQLSSSMGKGRQ